MTRMVDGAGDFSILEDDDISNAAEPWLGDPVIGTPEGGLRLPRSVMPYRESWGTLLTETLIEPTAEALTIGQEAENPLASARNTLLGYTKLTYPQYKDDSFHRHLAAELTAMVTGVGRESNYLMLFAPPQHGKSHLTSFQLPTFWLGHHPDMPVALVSYAASLAYRNSRVARNIMRTDEWRQVFPDVHPDGKQFRVQDWHVLNRKGYCYAVGVGGGITGHGFKLIIVDDPIESWADAQSETIRETVYQWWKGTLRTRLWEDGLIILMMTRWHEDDLAGRVLQEEGTIEEGGKWKVLRYPALAEEDDILGRQPGEALAPSRYSRGYLEELRETLGDFVWTAEYQQRPTKPQGTFFKVGKIEIVDALPAEVAKTTSLPPDKTGKTPFPMVDEVYKGTRAWDLAGTEKKTSKRDPDSTAGVLLTVHEGKTYIIDCIAAQLGPEQVEDLVYQTANTDTNRVRIRIHQDPGQAGLAQIAHFVTNLQGFDAKGVPETGDKQVRASPFAAQVNVGNVKILRGAWNKRYIDRLAGFPNAPHDDEVDASGTAYTDQAVGPPRRNIPFKAL